MVRLHPSSDPLAGLKTKPNAFEAKGTGFFARYDDWVYLVTAQHIAVGLGEHPFAIRINKRNGSSANIRIDPVMDGVRWYSNIDDSNVDLSVMPVTFDMPERDELDLLAFRSVIFADEGVVRQLEIGVGDMCYAVGLFRLMAGSERNLPIVHTGNIALMPGEERIPLQNWLNPNTTARKFVNGYLVEMQNLKGLSGSPVFVRPSRRLDLSMAGQGSMKLRIGKEDVFLMGIWQSSWDEKPGEILAVEKGKEVRVPVGIGTVVPTDELIRLLEMPDLKALRADQDARRERDRAASPDMGRVG
jgi:hypothetical protein